MVGSKLGWELVGGLSLLGFLDAWDILTEVCCAQGGRIKTVSGDFHFDTFKLSIIVKFAMFMWTPVNA